VTVANGARQIPSACRTLSVHLPQKADTACRFKKTGVDPQAVKPGMSKTTKVLLILAGVGGVFALICCGGGAFVAWKVKSSISDDPAVARKVQADIVTIEIPPGFEPIGSMDFMVMRGESPTKGRPTSRSSFSESSRRGGDPKDQMEQMQLQFRQGMRKQENNGQDQNFEVESRESREFTIRDSKVTFRI